jgi:transposase
LGRDCEKISQTPAPFHPIPRAWAGPSLLAMIVFEKFGQLSPIAVEVVRRIDALFAIERAINGKRALERLAARRAESRPLVDDLQAWLRAERAKLSRHAAIAKAIDYMLTRWPAFTRFLEDGRICLTNNAAERALRSLAIAESLCTSFSSV